MLTPRGWFLIIGLMILAVGSIYFYTLIHQGQNVAPNSPPIAATALPQVSEPASPPQPQVTPTPESTPSYQYNAQGQLQIIRYPDGSTYTYRYDIHGEKISETTRTGRVWTYVYDDSQHPLRVIDPEGRIISPAPSPSEH